MGYPDEFREEVLEKVFSKKNPQIAKIAKEYGIGRATIFNWRKKAGLLNKPNKKVKIRASSDERFNIKDKLCMIKETFHMNELKLGEYCRNKGILTSDLKLWEEEIIESTRDLSTAERISLVSTNRKLKKEIKRKEKALVEAEALLVLSKKAEAIWGGEEEEK